MSILELRKKALADDSDAQQALGVRLAKAKGPQRNLKASFQWLKKSSNAGNLLATQTIADFFQQSVFPGGAEKAKQWQKKSNQCGEKALKELVDSIAGENISSKSYLQAMKKKDPIAPVIRKKSTAFDRAGLGAKVLIVDSDKSVCKEVKTVLEAKSFKPITATSVEEAFNTISRNPDISAIFCDYTMPSITGLAFKTMLEKQGILSGVPFIILTSNRDPNVIKKAGQLGISGWIIKPFNQEKLIQVLDKVGNHQAAA